MNGFGGLFGQIYRYFNPHWNFVQGQSLAAFTQYLNTQPVIRMWADDSEGSGHQGSTVGILRQLAGPVEDHGFGYAGRIEVYYGPGESSDPTLPKLRRMLPEVHGGNDGVVNQATVRLMAWDEKDPPADEVVLGFTGGADDVDDGGKVYSPNYARRINVHYFLRLQPYLWMAPDQIQFNQATRPFVNLTRQQAMGYESFRQRAYYVRTPMPAPVWDLYEDGPYAEQARIVRLLTTGDRPYGIAPVYSIRSKNMQLAKTASERMFEVITSTLASQRTPDGAPAVNAKSIVIVSCDDYGSKREQEELTHPPGPHDLGGLMQGGYCAAERLAQGALEAGVTGGFRQRPLTPKEIAQYENALRPRGYRRDYLRDTAAAGRVSYVWEAGYNAVDGALRFLAAPTDRVLLVQLGKIPEPLFYWLMQSCDWAPVFEGQGTANVALNIGKLYYHVARPGSPVTQYPTTIIGYEEYLDRITDAPMVPVVFLPRLPRQVQLAANWLTYPLNSWSADPAGNPAEGAGGLARTYLAEPESGALHTYFRSVSEFYRIADNDKLRMGAAFLQYTRTGGQAAVARRVAAAPSALEALLKILQDTKDPTLKLAPGVLNAGGIFDFYTGLLGASPGLVLTGWSLRPDYEHGALTKITVTGSTTFGGVPLTAAIGFTAPDGIVVSAARYAYDQRWALDEIPWIGFRSPFVDFYVADSGLPPTGAVGGTVEGADLELAFRLPVAEGKWQLAGSFPAPYPGIGRFFQLAGGIDLVRSLPAPFDGLAGFGLQEVQLVYDVAAAAVSSAGFRFATSAGFTLVGDVQVRNVAADVVVHSPGDLTARQVTWTVLGTFALGCGPDAGVVAIGASGPGLVLTGGLVSGVLRLSDIVSAFCPAVAIQPPGEPSITQFQASFTLGTGDYDVSCQLNLDWPVSVAGQRIFSIDDIGFGAASTAGLVSGNMRGRVTIGAGACAVPLELTARYDPAPGWIFTAAQAPGTEISLSALVNQFMPGSWQIERDYAIAGLGLTVALDQGSWEFAGRTARPWTVPFISGLEVAAALKLGYQADGYTGRLETTWTWQRISLLVYLDYQPPEEVYGIRWGALEGTVAKTGEEGDWTATLKFTDDTTLGTMVETMVSWATGSQFALEAPWSVLNSIPLSGLSLVYTFNRGTRARESVAFGINVGPIELGFARIDKISVTYNSAAKQKVAITLDGSFPWNAEGTGTLGPWDASQPGTAPAPPGSGSKYLDLRLLALGQHVTVDGLPAVTTIGQAIEKLASLPAPEPGQVPAVTFDAASAWIIGADMGILRFGEGDDAGYVVTVQTVFNDPHLYGLRLALDGDAAKVLAGLDFQVMYRQVSATVGVYQAEITLPDAMRHLSIGVYSLTLPVFGIAVYTNGDFQVDAGFPWNADFARSFTVEGIIYPGIPVTGSAGFYFGKLSSATTDRVPKALNGTFNPVCVFGFGLQLGFGKSLQYGVLKAGFSVTAVGIIEGVLATFNPYQPRALSAGSADPAQLQDSYYFWLQGTFGVAGRLYGSVDFAVVKAEVNVSLSLLVQITYEAYTSMSISVLVSVDVSASISIDLGFFSIRISFSFSLRVKETFTLDNPGTPPWITAAPRDGLPSLRLGHRRLASTGLQAAAATADRWQRLQPSAAGALPLTAWLAPGITLAHDERDSTGHPDRQLPCQVYLMLIETVPDTDGTVAEVVAQTADVSATATGDSSFERLAKMALRWVIAAGQSDDLTPEQVDARVVSAADLTYLLDVVLVSTDAEQVPIPPADVDSFLGRQFLMTAAVPDAQGGHCSATAFAMPPALRLTAPRYGTSYPGYDYTLAGYNSLDDATAAGLRAYFDQLAVQLQSEPSAGRRLRGADPMSMAQWVQSDYFLLLARQMTQAALDALRDFKYVIDPSAADALPADVIVADVNQTGELTGDDRIGLADLFAANAGHPLRAGRRLAVGPAVPVRAGDSFELIATRTLAAAVTATTLACANAGRDGLLREGAVISYSGAAYAVARGDSLITVARHLGARLADLLSGGTLSEAGPLSGAGLLTSTGLFAGGATLLAPLVGYQARAEDTFGSIAALPVYAGAFTAAALAGQNAGGAVLRAGQHVVFGGQPYPVRADDTLADVAAHFGVGVAQLVDGSDVLRQPRLLADAAVLVLPAFGHVVAVGDTLGLVASRYASSVAALAMAPANGREPGLFAVRDADSTAAPWLDIPHLAQYQVAAILAEIQRTLGIRQLSGMAARYALHGTRLPTAGIKPRTAGMWVAPDLTLPPLAGLYALTGQQIDVPLVTEADGDFSVVLRRGAGLSWLRFADDAGELTVTLSPGSPDAQRLAQIVATGAAGPLDLGLTALGADPMYQRRPAAYPLSAVTVWQSAAAVTLPYGPPPDPDQLQALRLWSLPGAMTALVSVGQEGTGRTAPRFDVKVAAYDEATGATITTPVRSHGWATVVPFTVKRVPAVAGSPATATTYEIVGASGADVALLERIVDQVGADDAAFGSLLVGYAPDATGAAPGGLQTDAPELVTLGIAQVNLSTETRPSSVAAARLGVTTRPAGLLNTPPAFVRLLWEASITRSGGFYLYYYDAGRDRGLPDRVFNDRGEAELWLMVLYAAPGAPAAGDRLRDYMTAVVTGDVTGAEGVDGSGGAQAVLVAEAAPMEAPEAVDAGESLARLAWRTYSDVADLAAGNDSLRLRAGRRLVVSHAVDQAPPGGMPLATIVARFGLAGLAELNAANPRWTGGLPDPLSFPVAINLPVLTLTVGTSPHTGTLADLTSFYGADLTMVAAENADVPGIFADNQQIAIPGGPYRRDATVPPGAAAVLARRPKPEPAPDAPGGDYGRLFLLNTFSLLGYQVAGNKYFSPSHLGLPAGPTPEGAGTRRSGDKVRLAAGSAGWEYRQSFGYPRFAIAGRATAGALPPADGDPYRGLGSILQVDFGWQDHYGNTLVSTLTSPATGLVNQPPMLTGYTDPLLALGQWPSVASAWRVAPGPGGSALELLLAFDPTRYQGLISAAAVNATQIQATFTGDLDPATAGDAACYRLDGGVDVESATLGSDRRTVTLTTGRPLTEPVYVLSVSGLAGTGPRPPVYAGSATFGYPADPTGPRSSTVTDAASRDLSRYAALYYQLTDANGMAVTVTTSLLREPVDLDAKQWQALLGWLFTGPAPIYAFLADRAAGRTGVAAPADPPSPLTIAVPLAASDMTRNQIYRLSVTVTLRRTGGAVLGPLSTTAGIRSASATITPLTAPLATSLTAPLATSLTAPLATSLAASRTAADLADTLGLERFARDFEAALSVPGQYRLKVAGGIDRTAPISAGTPTALWAVRLGTRPGEGISYTVTNPGEPDLFAPRPISNQLQTRTGVAIYDYKTGTGVAPSPSRYLDFTDIDMDSWGRMLLAAVDETLTPEFTAAIAIVSARTGTDYLAQLLEQKKRLARVASAWMIPLYAGQQPDPAHVREAFYQQLLSRLSSAYDISAGIGFTADVAADIDDPAAQLPPRLFGAVTDLGEHSGEITLTSPKLPLHSAAQTPLTFLLSAPETVNSAGAVNLDLTWRPDAIEHQIAEPDGISGYLASSWLAFVVPGGTPELTEPFGKFPVPLVLRAFPASPTMARQSGSAQHPNGQHPNGGDLAGLTKWEYTFTWSLPFHYVQDRVHGLVEFNLRPTVRALPADAFGALAQFVTVYPRVHTDLTEILARIDATTGDERVIGDAAVAVTALVNLLGRVTATDLTVHPLRALTGKDGLAYEFEVIEGGVELPDPANPGRTVTALLVTIDGAPPAGMGTPVVLIDPERYHPVVYASGSGLSYYYADATGGYLTQGDGQKIPDRAMVLPGLEILQRQDAWAGLHVTRNEQILPGRPRTAEPFVYTTPQVRLADPMLPTVDTAAPVDIAAIGTGRPVRRPVDAQLTALFGALFADLPDDVDQVTMAVEAVYAYRINPALDPVELPIFLQAPLTVAVAGAGGDGASAGGGGATLAQLVANWTEALFAWFSDYTPSSADGALRFDLTILSSLTQTPMPLLRLRDLRLALSDIDPPLPAS